MRVLRIHTLQSVTCILFFLVAGTLSPLKAGRIMNIAENPVSEESDIGTESAAIENNIISEASILEQADTNFTYEKYAGFLKKIADTSKYIVLPINEFRKKLDSNKIVIGLRHDVDVDLKKAYDFSKTETDLGFHSTYYILHTADYYLADPNNKGLHTESILPMLKDMQDRKGFEIGWHNDLVTLQVVYNINPVSFLHQELKWLRDNGIKIYGTASHGSNYCSIFHYVNFYFFYECADPPWGKGIYVNNTTIPVGSNNITINKGHLSDFGLEYEAYFLNNNKYFSDASFISGRRWDIGMLNLDSLKRGDRVIILLHPVHWHQASTLAEIEGFNIPDQKSILIDPQNATISITLPYGYDRSNLLPSFILSPGAYAKTSGTMQISGLSGNNFNNPVIYTVYAENRDVKKNWTVKVEYARNNVCIFESFSIPGYSKSVSIDPLKKTIFVKVISSSRLTKLPAQFTLSHGATAWIGADQQVSNSGIVNFSKPVIYKVIAEDGITSCQWTVTVEKVSNQADILSYALPGMLKVASIDTLNKFINIEVKSDQPLNGIPALFQLSASAKALICGLEQFSGLSVNDFTLPVIYSVIAEDSITLKNWTVNVKQGHPDDQDAPGLIIFPNPARGKAIVTLHNIVSPESRIEIFNSLGERVYLTTVENTGTYTEEVDLSVLTSGIYFLRCSSVKNPVIFILSKEG